MVANVVKGMVAAQTTTSTSRTSPFRGGLLDVTVSEEAEAEAPTEAVEEVTRPPKETNGTLISLPLSQIVYCWSVEIPPLEELCHLSLTQINWEKWPLAGRVQLAQANWAKLTQDPTILRMVEGCQIEFIETPPKGLRAHEPTMSQSERHLVDLEVEKLLQKGAVVRAPDTDTKFLGHLFLRQKKDGSQRPIFNLKKLNEWVEYVHFKMEGLHLVKGLLQEGDWLIKLDLKDAYFCVPMSRRDQKYLRFEWKGVTYQFQSLPFGLASAPFWFTKLLKPVVGFLRRIGIRMIIYLDDMLLMNQDKKKLLSEGRTVCLLMEALGFVINKEKSQAVPMQTMEFLGMMLDTTKMTMYLSEEKVQKIQSMSKDLLTRDRITVRELSKLIGTLNSTIAAILPAPLHYRQLQILRSQALRRTVSYETTVTVTAACKTEARWWLANLEEMNGRQIRIPAPDVILETDASKTGWGATCRGQNIKGFWTAEERTEHINALELRAVLLAIKGLLKGAKNSHILVRSDNKTTVAHINKMGGTRSHLLVEITKQLWDHCLSHKLMMTASYIPGKENTGADKLSREQPDSSDWRLDPQVFKLIAQKWGPLTMDLFASRWNAQLPKFVSWKMDPEAWSVDAFQLRWGPEVAYAFPPFCLISHCLAKLTQDKGELVLITPTWHTQPWYGLLLEVLIENPVLIPQSDRLLESPLGDQHPLSRSLHLAAWRISGDKTKRRAYLNRLPTYWPAPDVRAHEQLTRAPGQNGIAGVRNGKLIRFEPLWNK
jgi:hypothetical protein